MATGEKRSREAMSRAGAPAPAAKPSAAPPKPSFKGVSESLDTRWLHDTAPRARRELRAVLMRDHFQGRASLATPTSPPACSLRQAARQLHPVRRQAVARLPGREGRRHHLLRRLGLARPLLLRGRDLRQAERLLLAGERGRANAGPRPCRSGAGWRTAMRRVRRAASARPPSLTAPALPRLRSACPPRRPCLPRARSPRPPGRPPPPARPARPAARPTGAGRPPASRSRPLPGRWARRPPRRAASAPEGQPWGLAPSTRKRIDKRSGAPPLRVGFGDAAPPQACCQAAAPI
jgi:hypothetical protein